MPSNLHYTIFDLPDFSLNHGGSTVHEVLDLDWVPLCCDENAYRSLGHVSRVNTEINMDSIWTVISLASSCCATLFLVATPFVFKTSASNLKSYEA
jgi:hypothetical protein